MQRSMGPGRESDPAPARACSVEPHCGSWARPRAPSVPREGADPVCGRVTGRRTLRTAPPPRILAAGSIESWQYQDLDTAERDSSEFRYQRRECHRQERRTARGRRGVEERTTRVRTAQGRSRHDGGYAAVGFSAKGCEETASQLRGRPGYQSGSRPGWPGRLPGLLGLREGLALGQTGEYENERTAQE